MNNSQEVLIVGQQPRAADYSNLKLRRFYAENSIFTECRFENMAVFAFAASGGMKSTHYVRCSFDGSHIGSRMLGAAVFDTCSFRDIVLEELFSYDAEFINCTFSGVWKKGIVWGTCSDDRAKFRGYAENRISGNDLTELDIRDVSFTRGVDLSKQQLPSNSGNWFVVDLRKLVGDVQDSARQGSIPELQSDLFCATMMYTVNAGQVSQLVRKTWVRREFGEHMANWLDDYCASKLEAAKS